MKRTVSALPTVRVKPKHLASTQSVPSTPTKCRSLSDDPTSPRTPKISRPPSWDGFESVLTTATRRAAMLGTITEEAAEIIIERDRARAPSPAPPPPPTTPSARTQFSPPESYRWPTPPVPPRTPRRSTPPPPSFAAPQPDLRRWYHGVALFIVWHLAIILLCTYLIVRVCWKPMALCSAILTIVFFCSFF
ncbi:hypothetical protein FB45DRAFT_920618 [Roridomyces roridus]|uniref:Uncharacterized protein n=1 Tax=Roridomyces roridus TaxID=1738132 RepID=A0AAD7FMC5_9AGAR|nr:hypothetical protein FB45DRAFT_920618 [Roridomyces roridus]